MFSQFIGTQIVLCSVFTDVQTPILLFFYLEITDMGTACHHFHHAIKSITDFGDITTIDGITGDGWHIYVIAVYTSTGFRSWYSQTNL